MSDPTYSAEDMSLEQDYEWQIIISRIKISQDRRTNVPFPRQHIARERNSMMNGKDMTFDYTKKKDLAYAEILLPENAERLKDRQTLWNEVERVEKRKDARLSREVELALPKELNFEQQVAFS